MSLLLGLREWVGLGEAVVMGAREGLFTEHAATTWGTAEGLEARRQLITAYAERKLPMRLHAEYAYVGDKDFRSFIPDKDTERHPDISMYDVYEVSYSLPIMPRGYLHVYEDCYFPKANGKSARFYIYESFDDPNYSGYRPIKWHDVIDADIVDCNLLQLKVSCLRDLFSEAKGINQSAISTDTATNAADDAEAPLPPKTASKIYKECLAMAETIAKLSGKKAASRDDLAKIVEDECAKAGHPLPVELRAFTSHLNKA